MRLKGSNALVVASEAVRFLSGPESSWITGVCLPVDGGHHLRRGPNFDAYVRGEFGEEWVVQPAARP